MKHLKKPKILVVVAHPDDETIFMGGTILTYPFSVWRVLCATYGKKSARAQEALRAIRYYRSSGIDIEIDFLDHDDKHKTPNGGIDHSKLTSQLLTYRSWPDIVITHNEEGDYGNNAHIVINRIVKHIFPNAWEIICDDPDLFPVIQYRTVWKVELSAAVQERKREIFLECYPSQQLLWNRTAYLVDWAFSRGVEYFGRMTSRERHMTALGELP